MVDVGLMGVGFGVNGLVGFGGATSRRSPPHAATAATVEVTTMMFAAMDNIVRVIRAPAWFSTSPPASLTARIVQYARQRESNLARRTQSTSIRTLRNCAREYFV
jgi:hypothetical protein